MQRSKIEWLRNEDGTMGYTWNPIKMRCSKITAGCENCWHLRFAKRHSWNPTFSKAARAAYSGGTPFLDEDELLQPSKLQKPSKIAVQLMGDLFHHSVDPKHIIRILSEIIAAGSHTFFILTKRAFEMRDFFNSLYDHTGLYRPEECGNIWVGVSIANQQSVVMLRALLDTHVANRWVSCEPLVGPVDLGLNGTTDRRLGYRPIRDLIHWVVAGAETGPGKRKMEQRWYSALQCECEIAGVPFFGKVDSKGNPIGPRQTPFDDREGIW